MPSLSSLTQRLWHRLGWFSSDAVEQRYVDFAFPSTSQYLAFGNVFLGGFHLIARIFSLRVTTELNLYAYYMLGAGLLLKGLIEFLLWRAGRFQTPAVIERLTFGTMMSYLLFHALTYAEDRVLDCNAYSISGDACPDLNIMSASFFSIWMYSFIFRTRFCFYRLFITVAPIMVLPITVALNGGRNAVLPTLMMSVFTVLVGMLLGFDEAGSRDVFRLYLEAVSMLQAAKAATDNLNHVVLTIVPEALLSRLLIRTTISDVQEASVIFTDVASFTLWSSSRPAITVVRMLSDYFLRIDSLLMKHDVHKVTTIGDAYWAVCGLPVPNIMHARNACGFALEVVIAANIVKTTFEVTGIRVGIATGTVYGIYGEDVNYQLLGEVNDEAEHLEQNAPLGCILISEKTKLHPSMEHAAEDFLFSPADESNAFLLEAAHPVEQAPAASLSVSEAGSEKTDASFMQRNRRRHELLKVQVLDGADLELLRPEAQAQDGFCSNFAFRTPEVELVYQTQRRKNYVSRTAKFHIVNAIRNVAFAAFILSHLPEDPNWVAASAATCAILACVETAAVVFAERTNALVHCAIVILDVNASFAMIKLCPRKFSVTAETSYVSLWFQFGIYLQLFFVGPWFTPWIVIVCTIVVPGFLWPMLVDPTFDVPNTIIASIVACVLATVPSFF